MNTRTASTLLMLGASLLLASCAAAPTAPSQTRTPASQQVNDATADSVSRNNTGVMGSGN